MALVLRVGGVRELLAEHEVRVRERAHHRRVGRDVEVLEPVAVDLRVERRRERVGVGEIGAAEHVAHGVGHHLGRARAPVDEPRGAPAERLVERLERGRIAEARRRERASRAPLRARAAHRRRAPKKLGSSRSTSATISPITRAASLGTSPTRAMRRSRCSTRPEIV